MHYVDPSTGDTYPLDRARWCADNGHYLNLAPGPGLTRRDIDTSRYSVWRYARALLVGDAHAVSLGEGWTPLVRGEWDGATVHYKLEFMMPSGSFKDRGMTVMVSYLKSRGIDRVLEDSSGNAGASLSAYAAAAGLACRILVPETASYPKIAQIAACGADVVTIAGSRQDVAEAALSQSAEIFYASHNWQPFFVEGTKTLAYELWEQLGFRAPDNLVVPLGYGSNVLGADRGFGELVRAGEIDARPRVFGVQAARCAPYEAAFRAGAEHLVPIRRRAHGGRRHRDGQAHARGRGSPRRPRDGWRRGGGGRGGDRRRARCARTPRPVRRAHVGGGRRRPQPAPGERRHPPGRGHGARADGLGAQGIVHDRRAAEARRPTRVRRW